MNKIIAIGGGDISKDETLPIDKKIVSLSRKKSPTVLFIPTASGDSEEYIRNFIKLYKDKLGCKVSVLRLFKKRPTKREREVLIDSADIIYVGGGNTLRMMKLWRRLGIDRLLVKAYEEGKIMAGLSAGAICWFAYGHSDSRKYSSGENADFIKVRGLGLQNYILCPHFHKEKRENSFDKMLKKNPHLKGLAVDNNAAILVENNKISLLKSSSSASAYKLQKKRKISREKILRQPYSRYL
jgi:dipeptidase E